MKNSLKTKVCNKCKCRRGVSCFYIYKSGIHKGYARAICKRCNNADSAAWQKQNPEKVKAIARRSWLKNGHRKGPLHRPYQKRWYIKNRPRLLQKRRCRYVQKQEAILAWHRNYYRANGSAIQEQRKPYNRRYSRERERTDPVYRIGRRLRTRIWHALKGSGATKADTFARLTGCSVEALRSHLEKQFKPGMSWKNYGLRGWHIDHITPCAAYDLSDPKQQQQCFHYTNLQPLWAEENIRKSDQYAFSAIRPV